MHSFKREGVFLGVQRVVPLKGAARWFKREKPSYTTVTINGLQTQASMFGICTQTSIKFNNKTADTNAENKETIGTIHLYKSYPHPSVLLLCQNEEKRNITKIRNSIYHFF